MRILQLHSNYIVYKPVKKEISIAEEAEKEENRVEEVVVLFPAVEKGDNAVTAKKAIDDVQAFLQNLKVNRILIYPYAHLSSNLSKPSEALKLIKDEEKLKSLWYILQPTGELKPIEDFDFKGRENLEKFAKYEIAKVRASQQMPPHVPLMKRLEIADYEQGSD